MAVDDEPYHFAICRAGYLVAEWNNGVDPQRHQRQASAAKSYYSCILGIAIDEGKLPSADAKVVDYYPQMMDVPAGEGPKEGRHAFDKDREITFRQLIANCSGYMKPDEEPGQVFHYQTYGMNIFTHALASLYDLHDSEDPARLPGCANSSPTRSPAPPAAVGAIPIPISICTREPGSTSLVIIPKSALRLALAQLWQLER
ncbi:MAG: hypothetical protein ACKVJG_00640 [Candidatus Latescibacterota bacterium]|jgi:CubicO group peptidase (beta-lactamase class C family)